MSAQCRYIGPRNTLARILLTPVTPAVGDAHSNLFSKILVVWRPKAYWKDRHTNRLARPALQPIRMAAHNYTGTCSYNSGWSYVM